MARADCETCGGSGWKVVERATDGAQALSADRSGASAGDPKMVWAVPCDCTESDRTERALARARVPERYRHCDFENYDTDLQYDDASPDKLAAWRNTLTQAKLITQRFAQEFPLGSNPGEGLLLMGTCGVGKTHLAIAALKDIIQRGHSGLFYDYRELLKEIQSSFNPQNQATEMGVLEPVLRTDVFVLDDVGSSKPSPWAVETVGHVLNTRYNENRTTIMTTNFLDAEFARRVVLDISPALVGPRGKNVPPDSYSTAGLPSGEHVRGTQEDSLTDRVGQRIRSRLYEMCKTVEVSAPDYRKVARRASHF